MISATCLDEKARLGAEHNFVHLPLVATAFEDQVTVFGLREEPTQHQWVSSNQCEMVT